MNTVQIIARKRDGQNLTRHEIAHMVRGFSSGQLPDYQMSAFAMAVYLRGMSIDETAALTEEMLHSGTQLRWLDPQMPKVDKHSTGGIGDKISVILAPMLACCGVQVPMISGRGLGATGGTLDKLESIEGFRTDLSIEEIQRQTAQVGCVITGATQEIAPADRHLYALRDVTATVASIPLITASILSKKLAEGLDSLVLDVKFGSGAFMKTVSDAQELATRLVNVGQRLGVATSALLTDMNQPLGQMVGNSVEIDESVAVLQGEGPSDLLQLSLALGSRLLVAAGVASHDAAAENELRNARESGAAYEKLQAMVAAQGGRLTETRPRAPASEFLAATDGYLSRIDAQQLGWAIIQMGGGRRVKTDTIDPSVGLQMLARIGDPIQAGQPLVRLFSRQDDTQDTHRLLEAAFTISSKPAKPLPLIAAGLNAE